MKKTTLTRAVLAFLIGLGSYGAIALPGISPRLAFAHDSETEEETTTLQEKAAALDALLQKNSLREKKSDSDGAKSLERSQWSAELDGDTLVFRKRRYCEVYSAASKQTAILRFLDETTMKLDSFHESLVKIRPPKNGAQRIVHIGGYVQGAATFYQWSQSQISGEAPQTRENRSQASGFSLEWDDGPWIDDAVHLIRDIIRQQRTGATPQK